MDVRGVMRRDIHRLRQKIKAHESKPGGAGHSELLASIEASRELRARRLESTARLNTELATGLPISEAGERIGKLLEAHQVVIVAGETGSGKTTQLPKICLNLGLGVDAMIGHTQPRRLAARTVAKRIAEETGAQLGTEIGYAVRFSDQVNDYTAVKVMTDGLLLNEIRRDRFLDQYDAIIIDEAHERSLNIDFLLGFLKRLTARRRDLKIIVTSATIDVARFAAFFDDAPIVEVGGRTFPVDVRYLAPAEEEPTDFLDAGLDPSHNGLIDALEEISRAPLGSARDVLAFFAGEREIFEAAHVLRRHFGERLEVMPLYARLSFAEQRKVFETTGRVRRVVLATNVAETSLTVPNIGYVIDPGFARINRYSYRSKLQRLPIEPISRASADQRKGRCGRIAPGVCYRLYSEQDYLSRDEFTDPEIRRVNLASVVLQMQAFALGNISTFPFIDPPDPRAIKDAMRLLDELQAIVKGKLTAIGREMARIPVDPRLARMLVEANKQGATRELMVIVAALAVADPKERPMQKAQAADAAHEAFRHEKSDFLSFLKLWEWLEEQRGALTRNRFDRAVKKRFISVPRSREWREIHRQLRLIGKELRYRENTKPANYRTIHECILSGSLSMIATHDERGRYIGARQLKLRIFPGSGIAGRGPRWLVAGEIVETSQVFARCVAMVEPGWIERQSEHLIKVQHNAPAWSLKRGEVMAQKRVSLYGLMLAEARRVSYTAVDPGLCRELFIRDGLLAGAIESPPPFLEANLQATLAAQELEAKGRRRDLLVSDDELHAFYDQRLPAGILRVADLRAWLREAPDSQVNSLYLNDADLLRARPAHLGEEAFPSTLTIAGAELAVAYRFAPGERDDGVSITVPVGLLAAISPESLAWGVPGFLPNVLEQWLRTLPKQKRRLLAPMPEKVTLLCAELLKPGVYRQGRLLTALAELLDNHFKLAVDEADWDRTRVDQHLLMYVRVVDEQGRILQQGRDIRQIKQSLATETSTKNKEPVRAERVTTLTEQPIDGHVVVGQDGARAVAYPGLVDRVDYVEWQYFDDERARDAARPRALSRLALANLGQVSGYFRKALDRHPKLGLHYATLGDAAALKQTLLLNVVWRCFFAGRPLPMGTAAFEARLTDSKGILASTFNEVTAEFAQVLDHRFSIVRALEGLSSKAYDRSKADARAHLDALAPANLLEVTPAAYLPLLPRYLAGIAHRLAHLEGHVPKDLRLLESLAPFGQRLQALQSAELYDAARWTDLRFLLEEVRLAQFAAPIAKQRVKTHPLADAFFTKPWKASVKRVDEELLFEERRVGLA